MIELRWDRARDEVTVRVLSFRQIDDAYLQPRTMESLGQTTSCMLSSTVWIRIEGDEHFAVPVIGQLQYLCLRQVNPVSTGRVDKACLPENGQIKETFDQDHLSRGPDPAPREQAPLRTRKKAMRRSITNTAAIEIDGPTVIKTGKDYPAIERVMAVSVDQPHVQEALGRISEVKQVASQHSTGGVPDTEFMDKSGIIHASAVEVVQCFSVPVELPLVKTNRFLNDVLLPGFRHAELLGQMGQGSVK